MLCEAILGLRYNGSFESTKLRYRADLIDPIIKGEIDPLMELLIKHYNRKNQGRKEKEDSDDFDPFAIRDARAARQEKALLTEDKTLTKTKN